MVNSMTGFARVEDDIPLGRVAWELKSVNHRYLEAGFRLPELFRRFENDIRTTLGSHVKRGKVDVSCRFSAGDDLPYDLVVNDVMLTKLAACSSKVNRIFGADGANIDTMAVLSYPGVLTQKDQMGDDVQAMILASLSRALESLVAMRAREGAGLKTFILERLAGVDALVSTLDACLPKIMQLQRDKLKARFYELNVTLDKDRLEQEMVLLLQKADVAEELHRLLAHTKEVRAVLERTEPIGRRLDFLMQELNREANTLGSKSIDTELTRASVEMKVMIEQMREQVQNIE
jgi:uncharacterized protein (TIGR00255 family)